MFAGHLEFSAVNWLMKDTLLPPAEQIVFEAGALKACCQV
jgi:hypothetical protein